MGSTCAQVKGDATDYFESHHGKILRAEANCPVEAIKVEVEDT